MRFFSPLAHLLAEELEFFTKAYTILDGKMMLSEIEDGWCLHTIFWVGGCGACRFVIFQIPCVGISWILEHLSLGQAHVAVKIESWLVSSSNLIHRNNHPL